MPRVSVLTPIYNTDHQHLKECIESILNQTYKDFEFLILNDSPDNKEIEKIVKSYKDKRIIYVKNEKNIGISASRNKLLKLSKGEYIAIFDHDDVSLPTRLEEQVKYLDEHPDIGLVSSFTEHFYGNKVIYISDYPEYDVDIKIMLTYNSSIAHTASMLRKDILIKNDIEYESFYSPAEDYRLWYRLMKVTKFYNIQHVLVRYRMHDSRTSIKQKVAMSLGHKNIVLEIRNEYPAYYDEMKKNYDKQTIFRLSLFGKLPLFKIKRNWIWLFGCLPIFKIKWE